jgi:hypothetical protein
LTHRSLHRDFLHVNLKAEIMHNDNNDSRLQVHHDIFLWNKKKKIGDLCNACPALFRGSRRWELSVLPG